MKVISISNIKGGVGKSSTASVLGCGLSEKGYKVLMVDSDPQTNLTMCFLPEQEDDAPSLYHIYAEGKKIDDVKIAVKERLDLLIGDFALCNADMQFLKAGRLKMLDKALKNLEEKYDFVIIDTPPNLGVLSLNFSFRAIISDISVWKAYATACNRTMEDIGSDAMNSYIKKHKLTETEQAVFNALIARSVGR